VEHAFPKPEFGNWPLCRRYLSQAQACAALIKQYTLILIEAAKMLHRVAWYLREQALYVEAEPLYWLALHIYQKTLGLDHPDVGRCLHNIAAYYSEQSKYDQAESSAQQALTILKKTSGPNHPDVAVVLTTLGMIYSFQDRYAQAVSFLLQASEIYARTVDPDYLSFAANNLGYLAGVYAKQGNHAEAESLLQRSLSIHKKILGAEHPHIAIGLRSLAHLYLDQDKYAEAEALLQQALEIQESALGRDHPYVVANFSDLAHLQQMLAIRTIHISLPYLEGSIEKISYSIHDEYFDLTINLLEGLLFSEKDVVFTRDHDPLPVVDEEQIRNMEQKKDNTIQAFIVSIPCQNGSIDKASYNVANNYMHLTFEGSIILSFDISKVRFTKSIKISHEEQ
jgi:tetratricopeptide (TPR) repeat protein